MTGSVNQNSRFDLDAKKLFFVPASKIVLQQYRPDPDGRIGARHRRLIGYQRTCWRLIKGYGDTLKRGAANYATKEHQVTQRILAGAIPLSRGSTPSPAPVSLPALADPEGESLAKCLVEVA